MNINKICACCGGEARGMQWWNRDNGYSLCGPCGDDMLKKVTPEEIRSSFGHRGKHWDVKKKEED